VTKTYVLQQPKRVVVKTALNQLDGDKARIASKGGNNAGPLLVSPHLICLHVLSFDAVVLEVACHESLRRWE
jgi:hypothetical protein